MQRQKYFSLLLENTLFVQNPVDHSCYPLSLYKILLFQGELVDEIGSLQSILFENMLAYMHQLRTQLLPQIEAIPEALEVMPKEVFGGKPAQCE